MPSRLKERLYRVDWIGSLLFVGSTTSFLTPLTWGGVQYPWTSWRTLILLILGLAGTAAFFAYEIYIPQEPFITLSIFANRSTSIAYFSTVVHRIKMWVVLYYLPLYFEAVKGYSFVTTGIALFPATFTAAPVGIITGLLITKSGSYRWAIWSGWATTTLGIAILVLLDVDTAVVQWVFLDLVSGVDLGLVCNSFIDCEGRVILTRT